MCNITLTNVEECLAVRVANCNYAWRTKHGQRQSNIPGVVNL